MLRLFNDAHKQSGLIYVLVGLTAIIVTEMWRNYEKSNFEKYFFKFCC